MPQQPDFIPDASLPEFIADSDVPKYGTATNIRPVSAKEHYTRMIGEMLPLIGGGMGGAIGVAAGGPLAPISGLGGAALGGGGGEAARQLLYRVAGLPSPSTSGEAASKIGREMAGQGAQEVAAQTAGPLLKPAAEFLERSAVKSMTRALKPSGRGVEAAEKAVPKILERRALRPTEALTYDMLGRTIDKKVAEAGAKVGAVTARDVPKGATVDNTAIVNALENYKKSFMVPHQVSGQPLATGFTMGPSTKTAEIADKSISKVQDLLRKMGPTPAYEDVREVRKQMDDLLGLAGHFTRDDEVAAKIEKRGVDAVRHELYKPYPNVARANEEMSMWKDMQSAFSGREAAVSPYERFRALRYGMEIATGAGGAPLVGVSRAHGAEIGGAAVILEAVLSSTAWKVASANTKDAMARAIWNQDLPQIIRLSTRVMQAGTRMHEVPDMPKQATVTVEESHK